MKITQLTNYADNRGGGVSEVVFELAASFAARGHETRIIGRLLSDQATSMSARAPYIEACSTRTAVSRAISLTRGHILHVHGIWAPYLAAGQRTARRAGIPIVISPHGMLDPWALTQGKLKKRIALASYEGKNLANASCIHALNSAEADAVRNLLPAARIAVIPNGVSLPSVQRSDEKADKVLLFLGRIHPKKGILDLVEGFSLAGSFADGWRLIIAGWDDGGHRKDVEERVKALGLEDRISVPGPAFGKQKSQLLSNATAFALTSYSEGLPMSILEAWSYSLPVLMTPECNLSIGGPAGAAVLCNAGPRAVANGLVKLFSMNHTARVRMGEAGRKLVEQQFSWPNITSQFESLYAWLNGVEEKPDFVW
ncbi:MULTISPECIES: glycosyltransferase [unclassified Thioclava]|uniref:glycosyltransferase n=1 Tax=unclassified Thioclava TaxID=2621713 RepID=UPI0009966456|nr:MULTISPECIES: glycosyltransferase [unclassified Thioclava]OOY06989.1 hypothetical protein BMI89_19960 [Thioclava sp. F36-7]OOY15009.1 hypothetical protein BMI85_15770 [Thioclava sp. DLFJ4-1]